MYNSRKNFAFGKPFSAFCSESLLNLIIKTYYLVVISQFSISISEKVKQVEFSIFYFVNLKPQISNLKSQTSNLNLKPQTSNLKPQISNLNLSRDRIKNHLYMLPPCGFFL